MKRIVVLGAVVLLLVGAGCADGEGQVNENIEDTSVNMSLPSASEGAYTTHTVPDAGVTFRYPADRTVFWNVDVDTKTFKSPPSYAAAVTENEAVYFEGESPSFGITYQEDQTVEEWIENGLVFWLNPQDIQDQRNITFKDREAVEVLGPGNIGGLYRVIIIPDGENLIIIRQDLDSEFLDAIVDSISFE